MDRHNNTYNDRHLTADEHSYRGFFSYRKPTEIGCFSVDETKAFCDDGKAKLKVFCPPPENQDFQFDLKLGFDSFIDAFSKLKVDCVHAGNCENNLIWLIKHNRNLKADFICLGGGILHKIVCSPYASDDWALGVSKFNGTLYVCEFATDKKVNSGVTFQRSDEYTYWGHKFEHYVTRKITDERPENRLTPINNTECYRSVMQADINKKHSLIFNAEIDCFGRARADRPHDEYIELKTHHKLRHIHRLKLLRWWAQSFLNGTKTIVCGFRDDDGIVDRIQSYEVDNLPKMEAPGPPWRTDVCMNFYSEFLSFVKKTVIEDDPKVVYMFRFDPDERRRVVVEKKPRGSPNVFMPDWYIEEMA
ncbi:decapping and exoribonuclease protein-like [Tubulanus polymorphus]|uniref:decapping and exoribonuclease protein-like n=1 Tax=Tubulanus polymorphus TaxID=672921 RepID=UPI003DA3362A